MLEPTRPILPTLTGGTRLALAPPRTILSVAAFNGQAAALAQALGAALPTAPRVVTQGDVLWLWSGVDSWLAIGATLKLASEHAAIVDQSHGRVILHLTGPRAPDVLAKLVPIDLHPAAFPPDATALTLAGAINVQLWRHGPDGFALACMSSLAQALGEALAEAAAEYAAESSPHG